jgi:predicted SAM-dependent methyltransferase
MKSQMKSDPLEADATPRSCNVCQEPLVPLFTNVRDPVTRESFAILTCSRCGLGHTDPRPSGMKRYYAEPYYGNRHGITAEFCTRRALRLLESAAGKSIQKRLLDVGCGDGSFLLAAKEAGWRVVGTEINTLWGKTSSLDVRPSLDHMGQNERFDCVTMWHSLEHMPDIKSTLNTIGGLLTKTGTLIIAVPNTRSPQAKYFGSRWIHLDVPRHLYHFDSSSLRFSLKRAGFHIRRIRYPEIEYSLMGWTQSVMNCLNPTPNVFLDMLTGKGGKHSRGMGISNFILGAILTLAFAPLLPLEALVRQSGTFVMVGSKK